MDSILHFTPEVTDSQKKQAEQELAALLHTCSALPD